MVRVIFCSALVFLMSCDQHLSMPTMPAGKAMGEDASEETIIDPVQTIYWPCSSTDSVFTVFYGTTEFHVEGSRVRVYDHDEGDDIRIYWADETTRSRPYSYLAGVRRSESRCGVWSDAFDVSMGDTSQVLIYPSWVRLWHLHLGPSFVPAYYHYIEEEDDYVRVLWHRRDGRLIPIDMYSAFYNGDPKPDKILMTLSSNGYKGYYMPLNVTDEVVSETPLIGSTEFRADLRPYLTKPLCAGAACPAWEEPLCPANTGVRPFISDGEDVCGVIPEPPPPPVIGLSGGAGLGDITIDGSIGGPIDGGSPPSSSSSFTLDDDCGGRGGRKDEDNCISIASLMDVSADDAKHGATVTGSGAVAGRVGDNICGISPGTATITITVSGIIEDHDSQSEPASRARSFTFQVLRSPDGACPSDN